MGTMAQKYEEIAKSLAAIRCQGADRWVGWGRFDTTPRSVAADPGSPAFRSATLPFVKGTLPEMLAPTPCPESSPQPSRFIAEALVERHGPRLITDRATELGLPKPLTNAIVCACASTAVDTSWTKKRPVQRPIT